MANNKQMTVDAFQKNLKNYYIENGETNVESRIETLTGVLVKNNKGNNPFLFDMFFSVIQAKGIKLGELVEPDGKVRIEQINEIVTIAQSQVYRTSIQTDIPKEEQKTTNIEIDERVINQLKNIDYTKPLSVNDLELIAKNRDTWSVVTSDEEKEQFLWKITEGQDEDVRKFLVIFGKLTPKDKEEQAVIDKIRQEYSETIEKLNLKDKDGKLDVKETDKLVDEQLSFLLNITNRLNINPKLSFQEYAAITTEDGLQCIKYLIEHGINVEGTFEFARKNIVSFEKQKNEIFIDTDSQIPENHSYQTIKNMASIPYQPWTREPEISEGVSFFTQIHDTFQLPSEKVQKSFDNIRLYNPAEFDDILKKNITKKSAVEPTFDISTIQSQPKIGNIPLTFDMSSTQKQIEDYFDQAFIEMPDFYMPEHEEHLEERSALGDAEIMSADGVEDLGIANKLGEELTQTSTQTQTLESEESTLTFESKTGFEKLIDKISGSKNPLAQKLAQRLISLKNRDKAKLEAANAIRTQKDFTEKPSKGRFVAGDSSLMPTGMGLRNSLIGFGEGIMKLFQGKPKEPKPANVIPPTPVSKSPWDVPEQIKGNVVQAGLQAGEKQQKIAEGKEKPQAPQGRIDNEETRNEL